MESKFFLTLIMLSGLLLSAQQDKDKPNLIVIMTDDMGYADVGFNGSINRFSLNLSMSMEKTVLPSSSVPD